ncbi:MAG: MBL fold metallo-hydrolase [Balneolaceae bacterium]
MNKPVKIKFWGTRGSTPCANVENMHFGGNTTCLQITIPGTDEMLILDCGTGFRNMGNELQEENKSLKGNIFITHPHWDHLQGFPFFKPFYSNKNEFRIFIPPQEVGGCKEILQGHMSDTYFPISIDMLEADLYCETFQMEKKDFGTYSIEYMWAHHTIPTAIFKLGINENTIVFAPDNELPIDRSIESKEYIDNFAAFIHGADILIHDAQYNEEQYQKRQGWGHSAREYITELASQEKVKQLYLTHHDPDSTDDYLLNVDKRIKEEFKSFEEICLVKEGQEIILPSKNLFNNIAAG